MPDLFEDGIYFGLEETPYHADPALGSTAIKTLASDPIAYWWDSPHNPKREIEEEEKAHLVVGSAVHKFVLEGAGAFHSLYEREPDGEHVLRSSDSLGAWLKDKGAEKVPATKAARIALIRDVCAGREIELPCIFDVVEAEAIMAGRTLLKAKDFDRIIEAGAAVRAHPYLPGAFDNGYPEVSIFWTDTVDGEPVRRKARIDYLKPRACVDLKSTRNKPGKTFVEGCRHSLAEYNYPSQAAGYMQARACIPRLIEEGRVFGDVDPAWLAKLAAAEGFAFVFVFWASAKAPQVWGGTIGIGSDLFRVGEVFVNDGLRNFVNARRTYGLDTPWIEHLPLAEIELDHLPRWYGGPR